MAKKEVGLIIDCIVEAKDGKLSTIEIRDHINCHTKYGTTSAELKAFMGKQRIFMKDGSSMIHRPSGCYRVDMWKVNEELMREAFDIQIIGGFRKELVELGWTENDCESLVNGARMHLKSIPPKRRIMSDFEMELTNVGWKRDDETFQIVVNHAREFLQ